MQEKSEIEGCKIKITETFSDGRLEERTLELNKVVGLDVTNVPREESNLMGLLNPLTYVEAFLPIFDFDTDYHYALLAFSFRDGSKYLPRLIMRTHGDAGSLFDELLALCYVPEFIWNRGLNE